MTNTTILVLDANQRSALAVIRSLGQIDNLTIITADDPKESLGGSSKYAKAYYQYPSVAAAPSEFLSWLAKFIAEHKIDWVFPVTEITSQLVLQNKSCLVGAKIPFAEYDTVMMLADKGRLMRLGQSIGVPIPKTQFYERAAEVDTDSISDFPVVIKPVVSHIFRGNDWLSTAVEIAHTKEQLVDCLANSEWLSDYPFMLQEYIDGHGQGVFALYDRGKPVAFFAHRRIREKPPGGGVSVLCASAPLDKAIKQDAKKLLDAADWHGVAMVEYRVAKDGTAYLMEVNTRFWGSLQLAIDAGVDFPTLLYRISNKEPVSPVVDYRQGVRMRWLLGDIDSLYLLLRSRRFSVTQKLKGIAAFLWPRPFITYHQVNRWNDIGPAIAELKQYFKNLRS